MHYKINDTIVKLENAAKPTFTPSRYMLYLLEQYISKKDTVLDYGCGKLRYTIPVSKIAKSVYGVDSKEELFRSIKIKGQKTTITNFSEKYKNIYLHTTTAKSWQEIKYDKIILSHVLSAIPHEKDRIKIVKKLYKVMHENSVLIACTNHRMSYFKKWDKSPKIDKYNDGYFVKEPAPSYFGVINKAKLTNYFIKNKFEILKSYIEEDNAYCICKRAC